MTANRTGTTIIPTLRYRDGNKAVRFLKDAFGFAEHAVYRDDKGGVMHGELSFGTGMIMIGEVRETEFGKHMVQPDETGGKVTMAIYMVVPDVDAHFARAKAAGARILREPVDQDYGGRDYSCADPDGHVWSFGSYDPFAPPKA
jgi:uncharacterized glyoxalase superfamily protein PhnB